MCPFRVLATHGGGARAGEVVGMDLEAHPFLAQSESAYFDRSVADADAEVAKRHAEKLELEAAVVAQDEDSD